MVVVVIEEEGASVFDVDPEVGVLDAIEEDEDSEVDALVAIEGVSEVNALVAIEEDTF